MKIIKRTGKLEEFNPHKITNAIKKAFEACNLKTPDLTGLQFIINGFMSDKQDSPKTVEEIQDIIEEWLMFHYPKVAKSFIIYREKHKESRFTTDRINYIRRYKDSNDNAASSSETDVNANVTIKNVANLSGEVYKTNNRIIQRQFMKEMLTELYDSKLAKQYVSDIEHHSIYIHDESSTPVPANYCEAVTLYPLMLNGVGNMDGVTPTPPNDLQSFSGQLVNLLFLLSAQCKGAVAISEYFIALNYYVIADFGPEWYKKLEVIVTSDHNIKQKTIKHEIEKAFKQFVWGVNQPAGNRSYQSPFTNISYFDRTYFMSMFGSFTYPDGTKPAWTAIDTLQRMFMKWFNKTRLTQVLTFPVETFAMVYNPETDDIIDKKYKDLCAEMYSEGHSFFTYISDSADSLASCCRLRNKVNKNTFNPTTGLTGVQTGSCNVITLNINRIIQDYFGPYKHDEVVNKNLWNTVVNQEQFIVYLKSILDRVYKYHIAYKTILYDFEDKKMITASNAGYIYMKKLYSTIGINGLNEAARFLGLEVSNNDLYIKFLQLVLSTIKEANAENSVHDKKYPVLFNSEVVPAEGLGSKNYNWDKEDGYWVPEDKNLYNSYFYDVHDNTSILDKFILHGKQTYQFTDGGSALHCNLDDHLSKEQYLKLIDVAIREGTSYFTFNIPNTKCKDCGYITKHPLKKCPKCNSTNLEWYTRVIGFMRPISSFGKERKEEASHRVYSNGKIQI